MLFKINLKFKASKIQEEPKIIPYIENNYSISSNTI